MDNEGLTIRQQQESLLELIKLLGQGLCTMAQEPLDDEDGYIILIRPSGPGASLDERWGTIESLPEGFDTK